MWGKSETGNREARQKLSNGQLAMGKLKVPRLRCFVVWASPSSQQTGKSLDLTLIWDTKSMRAAISSQLPLCSYLRRKEFLKQTQLYFLKEVHFPYFACFNKELVCLWLLLSVVRKEASLWACLWRNNPDQAERGGKSHLHCRRHHSVGCGPGLTTKERVSGALTLISLCLQMEEAMWPAALSSWLPLGSSFIKTSSATTKY